jgi:hypothetical protein
MQQGMFLPFSEVPGFLQLYNEFTTNWRLIIGKEDMNVLRLKADISCATHGLVIVDPFWAAPHTPGLMQARTGSPRR